MERLSIGRMARLSGTVGLTDVPHALVNFTKIHNTRSGLRRSMASVAYETERSRTLSWEIAPPTWELSAVSTVIVKATSGLAFSQTDWADWGRDNCEPSRLAMDCRTTAHARFSRTARETSGLAPLMVLRNLRMA